MFVSNNGNTYGKCHRYVCYVAGCLDAVNVRFKSENFFFVFDDMLNVDFSADFCNMNVKSLIMFHVFHLFSIGLLVMFFGWMI